MGESQSRNPGVNNKDQGHGMDIPQDSASKRATDGEGRDRVIVSGCW